MWLVEEKRFWVSVRHTLLLQGERQFCFPGGTHVVQQTGMNTMDVWNPCANDVCGLLSACIPA